MSLPTSGPISFSQIQEEYGGTNPISLSEYYRNGGLVPGGPFNVSIPTAGQASLSNYRGGRKSTIIVYQIIGGGGGGGYGLANGGGSGRAPSGGISSIIGPSINISAAGGLGGANGSRSRFDTAGINGDASIYGSGGAAPGNNRAGNPAPAQSFGAGGSGGGGDSPSTYDRSGNAGEGGFAGQYLTGSFTVDYNSQLNITIGLGGAGSSGGNYRGGAGAKGYATLIYDGKTINFSSSSSYIVV